MELLCGIFQQPCMVVFRSWSVCRVTSPSVGHTHTSFWVLGGEESKETKTAGWAKTEITLYVVPILLHLSDFMNAESWIVKYEFKWYSGFMMKVLFISAFGWNQARKGWSGGGSEWCSGFASMWLLQPEGNSIFYSRNRWRTVGPNKAEDTNKLELIPNKKQLI